MSVKLIVMSLIFYFLVVSQGLQREKKKIRKIYESGNMPFKFSATNQDGSVGYLGYQYKKIKYISSYNLTGAQVSVIATFNSLNRIINPDKLCITDKYLISYSGQFLAIDYFNLTSLDWIGSIKMSEFPYLISFLRIKKVILFVSTTGNIKTFGVDEFNKQQNYGEQVSLVDGLIGPIEMSVSSQQEYIAVCDNSSIIRIFQLQTKMKVFQSALNNKLNRCKCMSWSKAENMLFYSYQNEWSFNVMKIEDKLDIEVSSVSYTLPIQLRIYGIHYLQSSGRLIIVGSMNGMRGDGMYLEYDWRGEEIVSQGGLLGVNNNMGQYGVQFVEQYDGGWLMICSGLNKYRVQISNGIDVLDNGMSSVFFIKQQGNIQLIEQQGYIMLIEQQGYMLQIKQQGDMLLIEQQRKGQRSKKITKLQQQQIKLQTPRLLLLGSLITTTNSSLTLNLGIANITLGGSTNTSNTTTPTTSNTTNTTTTSNTTTPTTSNTTNTTTTSNTTQTTNTTASSNTTNTNDTSTIITNTTTTNTTTTNTTTTNTTTTNTTTTNTTTNSTTNSNDTSTTPLNNNNTPLNNNNTNNTNNTTPLQQPYSLNQISNQEYATYHHFLSSILQNQNLLSLNNIPGARKLLKPIFAFFINFDDLWLYIYHPIQYNKVIQSVFQMTQTLQSQKWNLVPFATLWSKLGIDTQAIYNIFNYRANYTSYKFTKVQKNSNGLFINTVNLFFSNLFFTLAIFISLKIFYNIFSNCKFSQFFKPFTFWPVFVLMLLEGNVQIITYLFVFDVQNMFTFKAAHKFSLCATLILYFLVFFFCAAAILLFKNYYKKLSKYLIQNLNMDMVGITYFCVFFGYKNIAMGFFHALFDQNYILKLSLLLTTQTILFIYSIVLLRKRHCFVIKMKVWINQFTAFARIMIIITFMIDENSSSISSTMLEYPHLVIVYFYMSLFAVGIFTEICIICGEIKSLYCNFKQPRNSSKYHNHKQLNQTSKSFFPHKKQIKFQQIDQHTQVSDNDHTYAIKTTSREDLYATKDNANFKRINTKKVPSLIRKIRQPKSQRSMRYKNLILNRVHFQTGAATKKEIRQIC